MALSFREAFAASLAVGTATGTAGTTVTVPITFTAAGDSVAALELSIGYDANVLQALAPNNRSGGNRSGQGCYPKYWYKPYET